MITAINHLLKIKILELSVLLQQQVQVLPIGRNIVIPQRNSFIERKPVHNWQYFVQQNPSYYQPQSAIDSSYYQPQYDKYNQGQTVSSGYNNITRLFQKRLL